MPGWLAPLRRFLDSTSPGRLVLAGLMGLMPSLLGAAEPWQPVNVPGPLTFSGQAWIRLWVKVPDSYFAAHPRNLFEESVGLHIRDLAGAHEAWVNGRRIGAGGAFPPDYQSGREVIHRHKVPVGTLVKGQWNEIALHLYMPAGPGGFLGDAPFIMDYFTEGTFEGTWQFMRGADYTPGSARAEPPPVAAFERFHESNRVLGRAQQVPGPSLAPEDSAAQLRPAPDYAVDLLLHEPLVAQPTHFSWDARGRLWVAQYRQYPYPAGLTMLSRDKYYRSHYDKVPPPPPHHDRGADLVSIHEDTDGDGFYDRHKVFAEGLNMANAVVRGHGGVWIMQTPYLLFFPDADGDDVPDGPPEVRLEGFGFEDTHSVANGLVWGPDGWLYGAQGSTTSCRVRRPGLDPPEFPGVHFEGCMVWRYHPRSRAFEIFAEGGGNTFGLEFDAQGRLHSGHNGAGTRGFHFVQGGFYEMQGVNPGKFGPPRNPYAFGHLSMIRTTNDAVRFTHFGAFAEGTAMPSSAAGLLFSLDPLHNVVLTSQRIARGATFETVDDEPALRSEDVTFRPLYIANAPDGSLFISDMCEFYIAHGQHYQNQIDPRTGRIYRLRGKDATLEKEVNLADLSTPQLIEQLAHPNKWHRHTAVRLLGERRDQASVAPLQDLLASDDGLAALNALWALHQVTALDPSAAQAGLAHPSPAVRAWTIRLMGDAWGRHPNLGTGPHRNFQDVIPSGRLPEAFHNALVKQAAAERNPEVLSQIASTARRLAPAQGFPLVAAVLGHDEMTDDPYIPLLCWWVFEAHLPAAHAQLLALLREPEFWERDMVRGTLLPRLARRYAVDGRHAELVRCADLFRLAPSADQVAPLLQGFEEAFRGRSVAALPDELVSALGASGQTPLALRLRQGDPAALEQALLRLRDPKAPVEERQTLVRTLGELRLRPAIPVLQDIMSSPSEGNLHRPALMALSAFDEESIGTNVVHHLKHFAGDTATAAFALLASRPTWSMTLLEAVRSGAVPADLVPEEVAARLRESPAPEVAALASSVLPDIEPGARDFQARIKSIGDILQQAPGNPYAGEAHYLNRCAACHKLFFKGGNIGPELTGYQRDNLGTMLPSIVNPSADIREGYQYYLLTTRDGRTLSGFFVERDNQVTVLRGLEGENVTLRTEEITELQPMGRSLMPEGLLEGLSDQDLRDLFAYLRISQPITP